MVLNAELKSMNSIGVAIVKVGQGRVKCHRDGILCAPVLTVGKLE